MIARERAQPSSPKQRDRNARDQNHGCIFGHKEKRKAEAAVLGVKAGRQFGFGFGKVKRTAVGFRDGRYQVDKKSHRLNEHIPYAHLLLLDDNISQAQRIRNQEHPDNRHSARNFITYQLRGGAKCAEKGVVTVGRPPAQDDSVNPERGDGQNKQDSDIYVTDDEAAGKWDGRENGERSRHADHRRQQEKRAVGPRGNNVFLEHQLDRVGKRLEDAPGSDAHRTQPRLHKSKHLALHVNDVHQNGGHHVKDDQNLYGGKDERMRQQKLGSGINHILETVNFE